MEDYELERRLGRLEENQTATGCMAFVLIVVFLVVGVFGLEEPIRVNLFKPFVEWVLR